MAGFFLERTVRGGEHTQQDRFNCIIIIIIVIIVSCKIQQNLLPSQFSPSPDAASQLAHFVHTPTLTPLVRL